MHNRYPDLSDKQTDGWKHLALELVANSALLFLIAEGINVRKKKQVFHARINAFDNKKVDNSIINGLKISHNALTGI